MTITEASCKDCGKVIRLSGIYMDSDGILRCDRCDIKAELKHAEKDLAEFREWLMTTYVRELITKIKFVIRLRKLLRKCED